MNSQNAEVLARLELGPLTPLEALRELSVMRLGARIHELRQDGYPIEREMIRVKTKAGWARVARYSLGEKT